MTLSRAMTLAGPKPNALCFEMMPWLGLLYQLYQMTVAIQRVIETMQRLICVAGDAPLNTWHAQQNKSPGTQSKPGTPAPPELEGLSARCVSGQSTPNPVFLGNPPFFPKSRDSRTKKSSLTTAFLALEQMQPASRIQSAPSPPASLACPICTTALPPNLHHVHPVCGTQGLRAGLHCMAAHGTAPPQHRAQSAQHRRPPSTAHSRRQPAALDMRHTVSSESKPALPNLKMDPEQVRNTRPLWAPVGDMFFSSAKILCQGLELFEELLPLTRSIICRQLNKIMPGHGFAQDSQAMPSVGAGTHRNVHHLALTCACLVFRHSEAYTTLRSVRICTTVRSL